MDHRILAQDVLLSNDTRATGLNNNDLIIGPSGAGKTRSYVKPNLMQCRGSMIVTDTKGDLRGELTPLLVRRGYRVACLDFTDIARSDGYNPLDYISRDSQGRYSQQDILTLSAALVPVESVKDPFWERSARTLMSALVSYVLDCLPAQEHSLDYVARLVTTDSGLPTAGSTIVPVYRPLLEERMRQDPDGFTCRQYRLFQMVKGAPQTEGGILSFLAEKLAPLSYDGPARMYHDPARLDLAELGRRRIALFVQVSDTDRAMDSLVNLFYTQALQALCRSADRDYPDHRLPVPVRFFLDDFATNTQIPDFDKIISVIRSREISASIILQSLSQLDALYGKDRAMTIVNNCDTCLYLGGQDVETAQYMALRANKVPDTILNMPLDRAYLFVRGQKPRMVSKYDLRTHPAYGELPEAAPQVEKAPVPVPEEPEVNL